MSLHVRLFRDAADLAAMQDLARGMPDSYGRCPAAVDMPEMLDPAVSDTAAHTALWEDGAGRLAGFAFVSPYFNLHFHFRPELLSPEREREMMAIAVARAGEMAQDRPGATLDACASDENETAVGFLRRHGFEPGDERSLHMARSLRTPFAAPEFTPGFVLRPLAGEDEVPAYVATHRAAYGTEQMTVEVRLSILRAPYYHPELDLVLIAPGGTLAAFCVCNVYDEQNAATGRNEGEIGIVGTHPAYRDRGLGRAIVLAGLEALRDRGLERAYLGVSSTNARAVHVYEAAGFVTESSVRWWALPL